MLLLTSVALVLLGLQSGFAAPVRSVDLQLAAHNYLTRFGYLLPTNSEVSDMIHPEHAQEEFVAALKRFQKFGHLEVTGEVDEATVQLMSTPRCGVADKHGPLPEFNLGPKWPVKSLTYKLGQSTDQLTRDQVETEIAKAFKLWSDNSDLTFTKTTGTADIDILFGAGFHGDLGPFDGPRGVLAHAYFPRNGDAHFDDDETWTLVGNDGIDLLQVAAHEFGHSLGLDHSDNQDALMYAYYRGYVPDFALHADDIAGIQAHYGAPKKTVE